MHKTLLKVHLIVTKSEQWMNQDLKHCWVLYRHAAFLIFLIMLGEF